MNKKLIIMACIAVLAVIVAVIAMMPGSAVPESATAQAVRQGGDRIACEDALWLAETFEQLVLEKEAQIPQDAEADFTQKEFESMPTESQNLLNAWRDGIVVAAAETYLRDPQALESVNDAIGKQFLEIYQAVMLVKLELAEQGALTEAIRGEFCAE